MIFFLKKLIGFYRLFFSPWLGGDCRFTPSCSVYMEDALTEYGVWRGSYLGTKRILRCGPWCQGGHDPVQVSNNERNSQSNSLGNS